MYRIFVFFLLLFCIISLVVLNICERVSMVACVPQLCHFSAKHDAGRRNSPETALFAPTSLRSATFGRHTTHVQKLSNKCSIILIGIQVDMLTDTQPCNDAIVNYLASCICNATLLPLVGGVHPLLNFE